MNKKVLVSVLTIGVVAIAAIGGTIAYFSDKEVSANNIIVAGDIDLKVDHLRQTYNEWECKTCGITLISDEAHNYVSETSQNAVYVGSKPPYFIHSAWTAQNDPTLAAAGAKWIWATDPTTAYDATNDVTYTFTNTFEWYGPITGSDLWFAIGSDNSVEVWLNGNKIGENTGEYGYKQGSMLHISGATVQANVIQGINSLVFKVKNWDNNGTPSSNPGGLIYKFSIDGKCEGNYFKTHCKLWGPKDLSEGDTFWNFDDIKPGDYGKNLISLHVKSNDAWACAKITNVNDQENTWLKMEKDAGDTTETVGELSSIINVIAWRDNGNNILDAGENVIYNGPFNSNTVIPVADSAHLPKITGNSTDYVALAWCAGDQTLNGTTITCNGGSAAFNKAQTDSFTADFEIEAIQSRNNANFTCSGVKTCQTSEDCSHDATGAPITGSTCCAGKCVGFGASTYTVVNNECVTADICGPVGQFTSLDSCEESLLRPI